MKKKNNFVQMPDKIFGISSSLIKLFLPPLLVFVLLLTSIGWLIMPKIDSIAKLGDSIESTKSQIKLIDEKKSYLLSIDQSQLIKDADYLSSAVLPEKNSYLLVGVIRDITSRFGYEITSFSLSISDLKENSLTVAKKNVATKLPISVELVGPTDKFIDLVKGLENNLPLLFIDSLETSKQGANSVLKMTISSFHVADNFDINTENLTINDLKLTKEESELLVLISQFDKNLSLDETVVLDGDTFIEYDRTNPF